MSHFHSGITLIHSVTTHSIPSESAAELQPKQTGGDQQMVGHTHVHLCHSHCQRPGTRTDLLYQLVEQDTDFYSSFCPFSIVLSHLRRSITYFVCNTNTYTVNFKL